MDLEPTYESCMALLFNWTLFFLIKVWGEELSLELVGKIVISEVICIFSSMQCLYKYAKIIGDHIQVFQGGSSMFKLFMFWSTKSFTRSVLITKRQELQHLSFLRLLLTDNYVYITAFTQIIAIIIFFFSEWLVLGWFLGPES